MHSLHILMSLTTTPAERKIALLAQGWARMEGRRLVKLPSAAMSKEVTENLLRVVAKSTPRTSQEVTTAPEGEEHMH